MFGVVATIIGLMISLVAALVPIWAFYRPARFTRRRMSYKLVVSAPLIHESVRSSERLSVSYGKKPLRNPHVVQIQVSNTGKRSIPSSAFDGASPLRIILEEQIVAHISTGHIPDSMPRPRVAFHGRKLEIGPSLIARDSMINIVLLVNGPCATLRHKNPLNDVDLLQEFPHEEKPRSVDVKVIAGYAVITFVVWWLIKDPAGAAHLIANIGNFLSAAANGLARFLTSI